MRAVCISMRTMGCSIGPRFYRQEILVEVCLMGELQTFLADVVNLFLWAVNGSNIELDWQGFLINETQRTLHLIHLFTALIQTVISISFPPAV
ncbi:Uncharacterised protein [uncultured archaeon]|nr:Uncharacterised protein [uncultured archaeon]